MLVREIRQPEQLHGEYRVSRDEFTENISVVGACQNWLIMKLFMNKAKEIMLYEIYFIKHYL